MEFVFGKSGYAMAFSGRWPTLRRPGRRKARFARVGRFIVVGSVVMVCGWYGLVC
jgi:hypothetical protein